MPAKKRKLKWIFLVFIFLLIGVIAGVLFYADTLIIAGVETAGTTALGTPTTLDAANLSLWRGKITLNGLTVANPPGYEIDNLLQLQTGTTSVDIRSLFSDTIKVRTIVLRDLELNIEQKGMRTNLQEILDNIKKMQQEEENIPPEQQPQDVSRKKLLVERIEITGATARVKLLPIPGKVDVVKVTLAPIVLENVGSDQNQAALTITVIRKIILALAGAVIQSGAELPGEVLKGLESSAKVLAQTLEVSAGTILQGTEAILQGGKKTLEKGAEVIEGAGKGIEDLMKLPGKILSPPDSSPADSPDTPDADKSPQSSNTGNPPLDILGGGKDIIDKTGRSLERTGKELNNLVRNLPGFGSSGSDSRKKSSDKEKSSDDNQEKK